MDWISESVIVPSIPFPYLQPLTPRQKSVMPVRLNSDRATGASKEAEGQS